MNNVQDKALKALIQRSAQQAEASLMDNGFVTIQVPKSKDDVYRLYCARKSPTYSRGKGGAIGKKSLNFIEYNPTNRGALTDADIDMFTLKEFEDIEQL